MKNVLSFLSLIFIFLTGCTPEDAASPLPDDGTAAYRNATQKPFYHGVASGDPLADRVIIWTRVTPEAEQSLTGTWAIATDEEMENVVQSGDFTTGPDRDYTVKIDVADLQPATTYFYQFAALDARSPVGRTRTAPLTGGDSLNFAVVSCSNYEAGFFNAFARIAERSDIDAVLHLGDYIYEYAPGGYGDTTLGRLHLPPHEIVTLQDYRTRYSQYRLDPDFQAAHQRHPFISIWDDHEITNNSYQTGAQNHQAEEGDYETRKAAARQAYYEWQPIRKSGEDVLYRAFHYGDLVSLIMLDERLAGRSVQADSVAQAGFASAERSMLGADQLAWFKGQLTSSRAAWKVIGNQVIFADTDLSFVRPNDPYNLDAWDGYPAEKQAIIRHLKDNSIEDVIIISGDTHRSWAFEVPESIEAYRKDPQATVAVEFGTTSITSANTDEGSSMEQARAIERLFLTSGNNPHLKYTNQADHGYLILRLKPELAKAEWYFVNTIREPDPGQRLEKVFTVARGTYQLVEE